MRHSFKKLLPSIAVALTLMGFSVPSGARAKAYPIDCATLLCLSGGWPANPSLAPGPAPSSSGGSHLGRSNRRCKSGAVPWARPMRAIGYQTTLAASLKPCTGPTAVDRSNPCQSMISFRPTTPCGSFRIVRTSISAAQNSISFGPSASSTYGMTTARVRARWGLQPKLDRGPRHLRDPRRFLLAAIFHNRPARGSCGA